MEPRLIPLRAFPSRLLLSAYHLECLFGAHGPEILRPRADCVGQFEYKESVRVVGSEGATLSVSAFGPPWEETLLELAEEDAQTLGIKAPKRLPGSVGKGVTIRLQGPAGVVELKKGAVVPFGSLYLSPEEAEVFHLVNGQTVRLCLVDRPSVIFDKVLVRVHPTYRLHAEVSNTHATFPASGSVFSQLVFS